MTPPTFQIGVVALIWNVGGVMNYFMQMNADALAEMTEAERAIIASRPVWATGAFAIAVFGGALGGLLLLLRKSPAYYLFIASLLGVIVQNLGTIGSAIDQGLAVFSMYILMPLVVVAFFTWYSKHAESKGWLS